MLLFMNDASYPKSVHLCFCYMILHDIGPIEIFVCWRNCVGESLFFLVLARQIKLQEMASFVINPTLSSFNTINCRNPNHKSSRRSLGVRAMRIEKPMEELYNVRVERNVSKERLQELGVSRWSMWKTGECKLPWDWHVDQLVYIEEGEVKVVPDGSERHMRFVAGDLVRYPKWFEADLYFNGFYQERYSFRAYGDD